MISSLSSLTAFQFTRPHSKVTLVLPSTQMVVLLFSKKFWLRKQEDQYLLLNVILTLINYQSIRVINILTLYSFPFFYMVLKFGELMIIYTQLYKHFLGLNRRAPNVVARNETGRLPLKLNLFQETILPNSA